VLHGLIAVDVGIILANAVQVPVLVGGVIAEGRAPADQRRLLPPAPSTEK